MPNCMLMFAVFYTSDVIVIVRSVFKSWSVHFVTKICTRPQKPGNASNIININKLQGQVTYSMFLAAAYRRNRVYFLQGATVSQA